MATQKQLRKLDEKCKYLKRYNGQSNSAAAVYLNGGLQMFSPACEFKKVGSLFGSNSFPWRMVRL